MELLTTKVPLDFNYFLCGDAHMGSTFHHAKGWEQFCDHVRSKIDGMVPERNYITEHGDDCDFIDPKDPRFDATQDNQMILQQLEYAKKMRVGIKNHYICKLMGNHCYAKIHFGDLMRAICDGIERPEVYGGWTAKITFLNKRGEFLFKHFATHGRKGISSSADDPKRRRTNKLLALKRLLKNKASGDSILCSRGHTHWCDRLKPETDVYFADDGTNVTLNKIKPDAQAEYIHPDLRWYVSTGSFYKQYNIDAHVTSYAERFDYDPISCGYQLVRVRNGKPESIEPIWTD